MGELEQYLVPIRRYSANPLHGLLLPDQQVSMAARGKASTGLDGQETDVHCWERSIRRKALGDYIRHRAARWNKVKGRRKSSGGNNAFFGRKKSVRSS